jgi:hypothetical protein
LESIPNWQYASDAERQHVMAIAEEQDLDIILAQSRDAGSNTSGDGDVDPGDTDERYLSSWCKRWWKPGKSSVLRSLTVLRCTQMMLKTRR